MGVKRVMGIIDRLGGYVGDALRVIDARVAPRFKITFMTVSYKSVTFAA